jgi:nucleoside-diphosphate-sugar epimerase
MGVRVLVTGGGGFLGRRIVATLAQRGAEVVAPRHALADLLQPGARCALVEAAAADTLVHAAWITRPGEYWTSPENTGWIAASADLFARFAEAGGRRVVFVGSCAEYDWRRPSRCRWRETRQRLPQTPYGAAKWRTWTALEEMARRLPVSVANGRVFMPVGRHEHPARLLPGLWHAVLTGTPLEVGPPTLTRDLMDVRDAGAAIAALALSNVTGAVNIGFGRPTSLGELAALTAGPASRLIRLGARPMRQGEPMFLVADPTRLRREVGFTPRYRLGQTLDDARLYCSATLGLRMAA